jgi:hypothetical protein
MARSPHPLASAGCFPSFELVRRYVGLSRRELAAVMGVHPRTVSKADPNRWNRLVYLIFLTYLQPDPANGWRKACLGLTPSGEVSPELAQIMALRRDEASKTTKKRSVKAANSTQPSRT